MKRIEYGKLYNFVKTFKDVKLLKNYTPLDKERVFTYLLVRKL